MGFACVSSRTNPLDFRHHNTSNTSKIQRAYLPRPNSPLMFDDGSLPTARVRQMSITMCYFLHADQKSTAKLPTNNNKLLAIVKAQNTCHLHTNIKYILSASERLMCIVMRRFFRTKTYFKVCYWLSNGEDPWSEKKSEKINFRCWSKTTIKPMFSMHRFIYGYVCMDCIC